MKILIPVLHYYPVIGGLETWTQNVAERLSDKAEIFVVTGRVKEQPKEEIKSNVKIFRTSFYSLANLSYSSLFYIFTTLPFIFLRSLKIIRRSKIDLLFCQGFLSSLLGYLLSCLTKVPFMVTVQRLENKNWQRKIVYNRAKVCIAASMAIQKYFQEIGCKNIEVIPNGIDINRLKSQGSRLKAREKLKLGDEFVIMTIARLEKVKGLEYLIKAIHILKTSSLQRPAFSPQLFIIGDGSERRNLENLVQELRLGDKVQFLGQLPNSEVPEYLAAADCFCLPSLKEGFGIAILEAMAAGLPVIATDVGGIPEIIEDGVNGILVKPKEPKEIVQAIIKIYSQPEFAQNLVKNSRTNLEKYNWQDIARRVHSLL